MTCTYDQTNKIWTAAAEEPIYNYNNSLGQILFHQLTNFSKKVIQIDDTSKTSVTGQDVLTWGIRIAQKLKEQQLDHNNVVGVSARNSTYVLPVALGCFFNCTPLHCVNPSLDKDTFSYCFGITKPQIIFCDGNDYEKVHEATISFSPTIYTVAEHKAGVPSVLDLLTPTATEVDYKPERLVLGLGQTVAILCSSGTTGKPKAVCVSGPMLLTDDWMNTNDSVFYTPSGIDWFTGLYNFTSSCINGFTRIITNKSFDSDLFLELVKKYKITAVFFSSRYVASLVQNPMATKENLSSLRKIMFGGSNLSETTSKKIESLLGADINTYFAYGCSEVGYISYRSDSPKLKSVGQIQSNLSMRVVDDNGHNLGHNEVGEILFKSPIPWSGYYGDTAATEGTIDSQGWVSTGDLGYVDNDNDLYLVDRKKEVLKYQGLHFWPREIEEVIAELCDVQEVCVVSLSDDTCGDLAGALVVKMDDSKTTEKDVIDYVRKRLEGSHKQLNAGAYFVDKLPHNPNGKLLKREAIELLKEFAVRRNEIPK